MEQFKIGDWVVVTKNKPSHNNAKIGYIGQIKKIDRSDIPYMINNCKDYDGFFWVVNVRKAESWEIPEINTTAIQEKIINSSTNVAHATKGQLPLYEVKKRVVLN